MMNFAIHTSILNFMTSIKNSDIFC